MWYSIKKNIFIVAKKTNDQIILEQIIKEKCAESEDEISLSEYFEIYTASEILKDYDLTYDDIRYGIVGDGGDGGIDSVYIFINGELIKEDTDINYNQKKKPYRFNSYTIKDIIKF